MLRSGFGLLDNMGNSSVLKQLETVQEKLKKTQSLSSQYNVKYRQLADLNKSLANGYIHNLNVIIDLSRVLTEYKDTLSVVIETLQKFDDVINRELDTVNVEHLQLLTEQSIRNLGSYFGDEVGKIRNVLASLGKNDLVSKIDKSRSQFSEIANVSSSLYNGFANGGAKKKVIIVAKNQSRLKGIVYPTTKQLRQLKQEIKNVS